MEAVAGALAPLYMRCMQVWQAGCDDKCSQQVLVARVYLGSGWVLGGSGADVDISSREGGLCLCVQAPHWISLLERGRGITTLQA